MGSILPDRQGPCHCLAVAPATNAAIASTGNLFAVGHEFGTILLEIALWRTKTVARWVAVAVIVGDIGHHVGFGLNGPVIDAGGFAVLTLGCLAVP